MTVHPPEPLSLGFKRGRVRRCAVAPFRSGTAPPAPQKCNSADADERQHRRFGDGQENLQSIRCPREPDDAVAGDVGFLVVVVIVGDLVRRTIDEGVFVDV